MADLKLASYTICKNEIKFVDGFMENMLGADYVVVLDTGSTDGCYERLLEWQSKYPEKIIIGQKTYDSFRFDVARNDNLDMVPEDTDIYISIDLDERMGPEDWVQRIKDKWIPGQTSRASYMYVWSHDEDGNPLRQFWYNKCHDKNWRWFAPVHELLRSTVTDSEHYDYSKSVNIPDILLEHFPDRTKSRSNYLPLLRLRKEENPEDAYGLIYLCHELYYRGLYEESIQELNEALNKFSPQFNGIEIGSCYLFMGDSYVKLGKLNEAMASYLKAIEIIPSYREPYLNLAKIFLDRKQYLMTVGAVEEGLKNSFRHFSWLERDTSWSYEPYDILCQAYYWSGDYDKSVINAEKALSYKPDDERLKKNLELCLKKV